MNCCTVCAYDGLKKKGIECRSKSTCFTRCLTALILLSVMSSIIVPMFMINPSFDGGTSMYLSP